ncbi:MAG: hypothetical protein IPJ19_05470 [Planctomycetes bacterium]|nr:hypothetical protein [Planctomycetota bacterium]
MSEAQKSPLGIIKRERVQLGGLEPKSLVRAAGEPACGKQSARILQHEGRARAIEFTCTCGETTLVELVFEGQPAAGQAGVKS